MFFRDLLSQHLYNDLTESIMAYIELGKSQVKFLRGCVCDELNELVFLVEHHTGKKYDLNVYSKFYLLRHILQNKKRFIKNDDINTIAEYYFLNADLDTLRFINKVKSSITVNEIVRAIKYSILYSGHIGLDGNRVMAFNPEIISDLYLFSTNIQHGLMGQGLLINSERIVLKSITTSIIEFYHSDLRQ